MEGAPLARLALLAAIASGAWVKGRNCYWNIASNMERGAPIRSAFTAPCVMRSLGGSPTPIAGADCGVLAKGEAQDDSV
jgi:hypothetical protein